MRGGKLPDCIQVTAAGRQGYFIHVEVAERAWCRVWMARLVGSSQWLFVKYCKAAVRKIFSFGFIILILTGLATFRPAIPARAAESLTWETATNLSRSGAASQPRLFARPDGRMQAIWWDRFDGILTAIYDGTQWSAGIPAGIQTKNLKKVPPLYQDVDGSIHAFWTEDSTSFGDGEPSAILYHSQLTFGESDWTFPEMIAQAVTTYSISINATGGLVVAYTRSRNGSIFKAGLYTRYYGGGRGSWDDTFAVQTSVYYRLLNAEQTYLNLQAVGSNYFLTWTDPRQPRTLFATTTNRGLRWTDAQAIQMDENSGSAPRAWASADGKEVLRFWNRQEQNGCAVYQEMLPLPGQESAADAQSAGPQRVMSGLANCPTNERFFTVKGQSVWIWGEGKSTLMIASRSAETGEWSLPRDVQVRITDPETERVVSLDDLHPAMAGDRLALSGVDQATGEAWVVVSQASALEFTFQAASPWTNAIRLSKEEEGAAQPSAALDKNGAAHVVWTNADPAAGLDAAAGSSAAATPFGNAIYYARTDGRNTTRPNAIISGVDGEVIRQPALLYDTAMDRLHLAWSGGSSGEILYSWALSSDAGTTSGWRVPRTVSVKGEGASSPQIAMDSSGRIYILYVVSLNEDRGVYLATSENGGDEWSAPVRIFDAEKAGWPMVSHPALAVGPGGAVLAAWVQYALPGLGGARGVFYAQSADTGKTWSDPQVMANEGFDWPRLAVLQGQAHLLFSNKSKNTISHRWKDLRAAANWTLAPDLPQIEGLAGQFILAASPEKLHLIALDHTSGPLYLTWTPGEAGNGQWTAPETTMPTIQPEVIARIAPVSAAALDAGQGKLAYIWGLEDPARNTAAGTGSQASQAVTGMVSGLFASIRSLAPEKMAPLAGSSGPLPPTPAVTITETATPVVEPTGTPQPTPTVNFNSIPPAANPPFPPLVLGGGLAAVMVGGIFAGWVFFKRVRA